MCCCGMYCSPEVLFETCVAKKFMDDDDDDGDADMQVAITVPPVVGVQVSW